MVEQNQVVFDFEDNQYWQTQSSTFHCLKYYLKEIHVYSISGRSLEMHMLRFFWKNAKVLEKMSLYTRQKTWGQEVKVTIVNLS